MDLEYNYIYVDIMTGENCRQFMLLFPMSIIGQFVHPVGGEGMAQRGCRGDRSFSPL